MRTLVHGSQIRQEPKVTHLLVRNSPGLSDAERDLACGGLSRRMSSCLSSTWTSRRQRLLGLGCVVETQTLEEEGDEGGVVERIAENIARARRNTERLSALKRHGTA
jgi:hypothetical protein